MVYNSYNMMLNIVRKKYFDMVPLVKLMLAKYFERCSNCLRIITVQKLQLLWVCGPESDFNKSSYSRFSFVNTVYMLLFSYKLGAEKCYSLVTMIRRFILGTRDYPLKK